MSLNQSLVLYSRKVTLPSYFNHSYRISNSLDVSRKRQLIIPKNPIPFSNPPPLVVGEHFIKQYYNDVMNDSIFSSVDCVVCMFYPSNCQFYIPFNKTILFLPAHRFLLKRCNTSEVEKLIYWMFSYPNHIHTVAAGIYDQEYIYYFTGVRVPIIYSSSLFAIPEPQDYRPIYKEILVAPLKLKAVQYKQEMLNACYREGLNVSFTTILQKIGE